MNKKTSSLLLLSFLAPATSFAESESPDGFADEVVESIKEDGTNIGFNLVLNNISYQSNFFDSDVKEGYDTAGPDPVIHNYLLATAGITLLPNTWKIALSYTGQVGEDVLYESQSRSGSDITSYGYDEGTSEVEYISFYTKPLETSFGSFGLGYRSMKQPETIETGGYTIVDLPSLSTDNARYETEIEYLYLTYNIPGNNKWYSGFGASYTMGTSNQPMLSADGSNIVIQPDSDISQIEIGINKTLEEVNDGLSFKTLTVGSKTLESSYYDYEKNEKETVSRDFEVFHFDLIYMFKSGETSQFYTSFRAMLSAGEYEEYDEFELTLGVIL